MSLSLAGKVAIITGGASGIGLSTAKTFLDAGVAGLTLVDLSFAALETARSTLLPAEHHDRILLVEGDVADEQAVVNYVAETVSRFGRLDISVQNAGIIHSPLKITEFDVELYDRIMRVNVRGSFLGVKHSIKAMLGSPGEGKGASVILLSSQLGLDGGAELSAYCASKAAIRGLMLSAAAEVGPRGIRVNAVCPGPVVTPMLAATPSDRLPGFAAKAMLERLGQPSEIAHGIHFLASDESSFITGTSLKIDGGFSRFA